MLPTLCYRLTGCWLNLPTWSIPILTFSCQGKLKWKEVKIEKGYHDKSLQTSCFPRERVFWSEERLSTKVPPPNEQGALSWTILLRPTLPTIDLKNSWVLTTPIEIHCSDGKCFWIAGNSIVESSGLLKDGCAIWDPCPQPQLLISVAWVRCSTGALLSLSFSRLDLSGGAWMRPFSWQAYKEQYSFLFEGLFAKVFTVRCSYTCIDILPWQ